jgi:hypothetical protein
MFIFLMLETQSKKQKNKKTKKQIKNDIVIGQNFKCSLEVT